jgi:hypothetical protein
MVSPTLKHARQDDDQSGAVVGHRPLHSEARAHRQSADRGNQWRDTDTDSGQRDDDEHADDHHPDGTGDESGERRINIAGCLDAQHGARYPTGDQKSCGEGQQATEELERIGDHEVDHHFIEVLQGFELVGHLAFLGDCD